MHRDDSTDDPTRSPDEPATPAEKAQAASFAKLIDQLVAGDDLPPAMASDDRALIEVAAIVRAGVRDVELETARRERLIEQALAQAGKKLAQADLRALPAEGGGSHGAPGTTAQVSASMPPAGHGSGEPPGEPAGAPGLASDPVDLDAYRRKRLTRIIPWAIATAAAAAALFMMLRQPALPTRATPEAEPRVSVVHRSRPADALIGQIPRERADWASERLDIIYADRLAGYRNLRLQGGKQ